MRVWRGKLNPALSWPARGAAYCLLTSAKRIGINDERLMAEIILNECVDRRRGERR